MNGSMGRLLAEREGNSSPYAGVGSETSPICRGTNVRLVIALLNSVHLILREAAGTVFPSTLLEREVSSEEDLIMWASAYLSRYVWFPTVSFSS